MLLTMLSLGDFQASYFVTPIAQLCLAALLADYAIICLLALSKECGGVCYMQQLLKKLSAQFHLAN
jgi:hypothetical protein